MNTERDYQRELVAAIDAELGGRRWSRRRLAEVSGINGQTLDRVFLLRRDMNVSQLGQIADALGVTAEYLVGKGSEWRDRLPPTTGVQSQDDALDGLDDTDSDETP